MICAEAKELLEAYVKGATDDAAREALEAHFASCEGCRLEAELTRGSHAPREEGESGPLALEPLATEQLSDEYEAPVRAESEGASPALAPSTPAADAEEEISFRDLVLETPEASSTAAAIPTPPAPASTPSAPAPKSSATAPAWDFEPVDPPRDSGPPAGSVNLAEQALSRKAEAKAKGKVAALRVALWAAGGLSGLALLGVSIWIALAFNQPQDESGPGMIRPGRAPNGSNAEPQGGAASPSDGSADPSSVVPGPEGLPPDGSAEPSPAPPAMPDGSVQSPGDGTETGTPSDGRMLRAGSLPAAGGGPSGAVVAPPQKTAKPSPAGSASRQPSTGAKSTTAPSSRSVAGSTAPGAETPPARTSSGASRKPLGPKAPVDDLEPVTDESEIPFTTAPKRTAPPPPSSAGSTQAGAPVKPAPGSTGSTPAPSTGSEGGAVADPPPAPPAPAKPIDRLHDATVQAAAAEDLEALRKLKVSWKGMIRTATAAERARAKREYADCLWAIQELSGRTPDRREALAAYRDYVLYAPAGANDSRTVGRMRFLEDVLAESE